MRPATFRVERDGEATHEISLPHKGTIFDEFSIEIRGDRVVTPWLSRLGQSLVMGPTCENKRNCLPNGSGNTAVLCTGFIARALQ